MINKWVKEYQCTGCVNDGDKCFKKSSWSIACDAHCSGTIIPGKGRIFLGLLVGFNRLGPWNDMKIRIFEKFSDYSGFDMFNIPVWRYLNRNKHTVIRGLIPRRNEPFLYVFLEDCIDKIDCLEIFDRDIENMD